MSLNLATILREAARSDPDKAVALFDGGRMTYAELDVLSDRCAAGLRSRGVRPRDAVALQVPNLPHFLVAYFGILKNGSVVVPLNVLLRSREVAHQLADSGATTLVTWSGGAAEAAAGASAAGVSDIYVVPAGPPDAAAPGRPFEELLAPVDGPAPFEQTDPGDTAVIVYTAGTTGRPKGAELTHFQLLLNADTPGRLFGIRPDDVVLVALPLFHVFGLSSELNVCVRFAATMSLVPRFEPGHVLDVIERDHVTIVEGVPTMYVELLAHPDLAGRDLSSLRVGISGGAPIAAEVLDEVERRLGIVILEGYGMSETASTITFNISAEERKIYSVGKPVWGVEVQVWDGAGHALPDGRDHVGELVVRGVNTMRGYRNAPASTAEAFAGGWFHTGDLGYVDEDGFVFILDRMTDLIIRGGYNVYPREVEEVLYAHPGVAEAAVIGVPDERVGEEVKAFVQAKEGVLLSEEDLLRFARERLAAYKYPRLFEVRARLPKLATGKIDKVALGSRVRAAAR